MGSGSREPGHSCRRDSRATRRTGSSSASATTEPRPPVRDASTGRCSQLAYEVFDLIEADGEVVDDLPLAERRARLEKLLLRNPVVQLSGSFDDGEALLEAAREQGLEGVMAKRATSRYQAGGRGRDWL